MELESSIQQGISKMENRGYWRLERIAFLALSTVKGIGYRTLYKIAQSGTSFNSALRNPIEAGLEKYISTPSGDQFEAQKRLWEAGVAEAKKLADLKVSLLFKRETRFPEKLSLIPDCPEWLFVQGNVDNLHAPAMTIVGTRKPTNDGIFLTKFLVAALAHQKCVTVSGLALGIDQTAHIESLRYGIPTIAVLGTGICENFPKGSEALRSEIITQGGTIVSEYLPRQSYSAENFVRRNRIQAALGDILFPTEWQIKSGTAHTVKFAHKYDKKIINLHMPITGLRKPELAFSEKTYGAISLEVPRDTNFLIGLVTFALANNFHVPDPPEHLLPDNSGLSETSQETSRVVEAPIDEPTKEEAKDTEQIIKEEKDPQLPLL
ncbi:DNA-processing protein DprA [Pseudomonas viridiflava]|uniref:DNA-processing protein DprA n=1 Tax=Pseudomonas viridiflava TaxID=33069 RepID=UPI000F01AF0D|nr:DNA-processing protein DprA [Pseudomonas viridiflava]MBD8186218.1 DNA-protecting protein DprA [Pseudomonas viridiflava]